MSSWPAAASTSTATTTSQPRWPQAPWRSSSSDPCPASRCRSSSCETPRLPSRSQLRGGWVTRRSDWASWASRARTARRRRPTSCAPSWRQPGTARASWAPRTSSSAVRASATLLAPARRRPPSCRRTWLAWRPLVTPGPSWSRRPTGWLSSASVGSPTTWPCSPTSPPSTSSSTARWRPTGRPSRPSSRGSHAATRTPRRAGASTPSSTPTTRDARLSRPSQRRGGRRAALWPVAPSPGRRLAPG